MHPPKKEQEDEREKLFQPLNAWLSDLDVWFLYGGGRWCRRRMRGADGDERRRRMKDIPTGKLGPAV